MIPIILLPFFQPQAYAIVLDQVILSSPVLNEGDLESLLKDPHLKPQVLPTFFDITKGVEGSLEKALDRLCEAADEAVRNGSQLLVFSDRSDALVSTILNFPHTYAEVHFFSREIIEDNFTLFIL